MAWRIRLREDPLFWATQLLPAPRARALSALHAFCREIEAIAHSEASASLKQALLSGWRSEIALLYEGRPHHALARSLIGPCGSMAQMQ
jgi:phytoene synthase